MSEKYQENYNFNFETNVTVTYTYKRNPPRVEECHGYHEFNEDEEINREIESVHILLIKEEPIDITSRLTKYELKKILNDV